ncbi:neural cell adhesion molecule L1.1-like [Aulostomus maculatus]
MEEKHLSELSPPGSEDWRVLQPPLLLKPAELLTSYTAFSLEDINLPCEASGTPPPIFRWVKDGVAFGKEQEDSGTLVAGGDEPLEFYEGVFRCYASNDLGTAMTKSVRVIVESQPVLQKQQKFHKQAYEGESIVLTCNPPESSTPPHIHWMDKKMVHITQSERVTVGLDGNLYFANLLKSDSRDDYICNAQYSEARTILPESAINLTVMPSNDVAHGRRPHLLRPSGAHSSVLALRGHTHILECIPKGLPTPKVEWRKKDGNLEDTSAQLDNHNRWLRFDSITQYDDGEYECKGSNVVGSITHTFTVTVEAEPYWVKEPQNRLYSPGETVRLDCQAEGIPTPTITWSINGQPIKDVDDDSRRSVSGGVLKLADVEFGDTAVYQCEAMNKHGAALLNTYLHVVELPPQILSSDGVVYHVTEGGNIWLHCRSFGSPRPHITWEAEDRAPLLSDPRISLLTNGTLELSNISHNDSGMYTCFIKHTNISITAHLSVFNRTVIRTQPRDVRVTRGDSALLDCDFHTDPRLSNSQIIWRKDGQKLLESSPNNKFTIFQNGTLRVTDGQSEDTADYTCEVITDLDHVKASGSITVVARPDPPKDLSLSEVEDYSLTLSWIPGLSHHSPITEFIVEGLEEQHSQDRKWEEMKRVPGDLNHVQLTLHPYCTYRFRVIAVNEIGPSKPSNSSQDHRTPHAVPRGNPTGVRSKSTDPGTLVITWDEMPKRFHGSKGFQYKVSWREAGGKSLRWNNGYIKSPPFIINNTGTYTPFEIKVQAVNSLGEGPPPLLEIGHSGEDVPEEGPAGVTVTVVNTTAKVSWNEARNVRGLLLGYKIFVSRMGPEGGRRRRSQEKLHHGEKEGRFGRVKNQDKESTVVVVSGQQTSGEVSGLKFYSRYEVTVTTFNSKGESPPSTPFHFSTPQGEPGPPASLSLESPSETSMVLSWTPPLETNGVLLGYTVQYHQVMKNQSGPVDIHLILDPSVTHFLFDSLEPSNYYNFQVTARTSAGDGPPITRDGATLLEGAPPSKISIASSNTSMNLTWVPGERERNHAFHIYYLRKSAGGQWEMSEAVNSTQGFYLLKGLQPGTEYSLRVLHENETQWADAAWTKGTVPRVVTNGFATQGWLIGLISAVVLLMLILLILCLIKRSKGGKYAVKDKEDKEVDSEARPMKDETFGEYSDADEKRSDSQPSLSGDSKLGSDDSLAEYGDSVDIQFNEDGSFIGQYSGRGPVPHGNESSGPASPVNAIPPPPIAPSMSTILNRPS